MVLSEEDVAALRADLERAQQEKEAAVAEKEAKIREYEAKLDRLWRERSLGQSFDGLGGGNLSDRRGTPASTMGPMWIRGVSAAGGLRQSLPNFPRGIVPKFPVECRPYEYIVWERHFEVFIVNQGLRHTISPDAPEIAVINCINDAYIFGHFGEALVTDHRRVWGYISEATAGAPFEDRLYECHTVSDALRTMREWSLPLQSAERHLLVTELERAQFMGDEDPKIFSPRISRLETTMHAVGIKKSETDIVQIILHQLLERYDAVKTMTLVDPQLTRQRLEYITRSTYSQRKAHEIAKQWPAVGAPAELPSPRALVVGRGFRDMGAVGGGGMLRQQQQPQQHWPRDGGMPRQQQLQQHWPRDGGMPQQQQLQQHWSRDGGIPRQQQPQQHWPRDGGMPRQQQPQQHWPRNGGMPRQQQQQQHWSRGGGMPRRQQQQQRWSRGGGIPHQHQRSSHAFPPARQARQQQPLQQPSRIPTIGGDREDRSSPLSETFFGGDGGAIQEWFQSESVEMPMFFLLEGPQQSAPTALTLAAAVPAAEAMTGTRVFPDMSSQGVVEAPTSSAGAAPAAEPVAAPATGGTVFPTASVGGMARAPVSVDETAASKAAPTTSGTVLSATPRRGAVVCWSGVIGRCSGGGTVHRRYYCP